MFLNISVRLTIRKYNKISEYKRKCIIKISYSFILSENQCLLKLMFKNTYKKISILFAH